MNFQRKAVGDLDDRDAHSISARFERSRNRMVLPFLLDARGAAVGPTERSINPHETKRLVIWKIWKSTLLFMRPLARQDAGILVHVGQDYHFSSGESRRGCHYFSSSSHVPPLPHILPPSTWFYVMKGKRTIIFFSATKCILRYDSAIHVERVYFYSDEKPFGLFEKINYDYEINVYDWTYNYSSFP